MTRTEKIQILEGIRAGTAHPDLLDTLGGITIVMPEADGYVSVTGARWGYPERMDAQTFARYKKRVEECDERRRAANLPPMIFVIFPEGE
jgi:hypothetical protein